MNAKEAIKKRCTDCVCGRPASCMTSDCPLFSLYNKTGRCNRDEKIKKYCSWCLHGNPFVVCSSPQCSIHIYRAQEGF